MDMDCLLIKKGEKGKKALFTVHSTVVIDDMMKALKSTSALYAMGQSLIHILKEHAAEIPVSERTLYSCIGKGYLTIRNIDMRRAVRYKKRRYE